MKTYESTISIDLLKSVLKYNKTTGDFTWIKTLNNRAITGKKAGTKDFEGYIKIRIFKKEYRAARLAWFFMYEKWPEHYIDHINGDVTDNRIKNLRDVTQRENCQNRKSHRNGRTVGACKSGSLKNPWTSYIWHDQKRIRLGIFKTEKEASEAYFKKIKEIKNEKH